MREYGVAVRIRTNGPPFAGVGLLGLSKLSLGWMKLGIVHERIQDCFRITRNPPTGDPPEDLDGNRKQMSGLGRM
jgi:hypothetical protein